MSISLFAEAKAIKAGEAIISLCNEVATEHEVAAVFNAVAYWAAGIFSQTRDPEASLERFAQLVRDFQGEITGKRKLQ